MISDDLKRALNTAAVEVFGTMYFTPVELLPEFPERDSWRLEESYVKSAIEYDGPLGASLCFYFPRSLAVGIASGFLGLDDSAITDQQLLDTMQEAANMIVGSLLGIIDPSGTCTLGIPSAEVVVGFSPDSVCDQKDDILAFVSDFGFLWLVCSVK